MNFRVAPDPYQKLSLLDDEAVRFEPAGSEPTSETPPQSNLPTRIARPLPCISEVNTPFGKKPIMKAMMTTACERNCFYCPFRAGRSSTKRITFAPDEMAKAFDVVQRAGLVDGMFLSSGIIRGGVTTQDKVIDTVEILRKRYDYRGYIHLKIMPGAEYDQIRRAMQLANRVSVNLEGATAQRLLALAPKKDFWNELVTRIEWMAQIRAAEALPTSIVTQFVVGAVGDTDLELLQTTERLYQQWGLRRAYYSSFSPLANTPFENLPASPALREFRLYQASFLLRDYGWSFEDLPLQGEGNLPLDLDPKLAWARENLVEPLEVNRASRSELLHVPGIGPRTADSLLQMRRQTVIRDVSHLSKAGVRDLRKATPYLLLNGRRTAQQLPLWA